MTRSFWSNQEIQYLIEHAPTTSLPQLSSVLKRSQASVRRSCQRYGVKYKLEKVILVRRNWSPEEHAWLVANSANLRVDEISKHLGIPAHPVRAYLSRHKLPFKRRRFPWEQRDTIGLLTYAERGNAAYIAAKIKRPVPTVSTKMQALGIKAYAGTFTMMGIVHETGYHHTQLEAARDALRQKWRRTSRRFIITSKQYDALMDYFRRAA